MAEEEQNVDEMDEKDEVVTEILSKARWLEVSQEFWSELCSAEDDQAAWDLVRSESSIDASDENERAMVTLELLFNTLHFCKERGAGFIQAQLFSSVQQSIYEKCVFASKGADAIPRDTAITMFKDEMYARLAATQDKENTVPAEAVQAFASFFTSSFFQHYAAYQLSFNEFQDVDVEEINLPVRTPQVPGPLNG